MAAIVINYTDQQFDDIVCQANNLYVLLTDKFVTKTLYYLGDCSDSLMSEIFLYRWVLNDWNNSTPEDNKITIEQLNDIANRIKELYSCNC